jgi:dTDP-4-amino-4,6-dideoxygalactose transaminase
MDHIERWTEARRALAARYDAALAPLGYRTPVAPADRRHVYHVYAIRHDRRDELRTFLEARGVSTGIHYPVPVHLQPAFAELGYRRGDFPLAEAAADMLLSLPLYPEMTHEQQDAVVDALADWAYVEGAA